MGLSIVINSWGSFGDVYPYVGLGHALQARGHRVTLAVPSYYQPLVEREGLRFHAVGPEVDPSDRALIARVMHPVRGPEVILREWLVPAVRQSYAALDAAVAGADLLVSHPVTFAAPVLAEKRGMPWVSTALAPISFFSIFDPPVLPGAPFLAGLKRLGPWFGRLVVAFAHKATAGWVEPIHALRASLGLPRGAHPIYEGQFSPLRTLALFSSVLASPRPDWPPHASVTGFVFYNGPDPLPPELEAFLDAGPPPVVFTLGSSAVGAAGTFYEESARAAADLGVRAVLMTGGIPENQPRGALPPTILAIDRAPHQLLFPRASAIVHQGGIGTTGQALRSGRPMLVVPHSHDQPDNAHRVRALGVARTLFPSRYRSAAVVGELDALLNDDRYRASAARVADVVAREGGAEAAAAAIEAAARSG